MRETYIKDFEKGDLVTEFFLVTESSSIKETKTGKQFGTLKVCDKTKEIECKCWEEILNLIGKDLFESLEPGNIVKIKGTVDEYNDNLQIILEQLRLVNENDRFDESDLYRTAPMDTNKIYNEIINIINKEISDIEYKNICITLYTAHKEKLLIWPAAKSRHHAYKGGLLWHTYRMLQLALKITEIYNTVDKSLLLAGVILHDIGKISELSFNNNVPEYSFEGNMLGNLLIGTIMINNIAKKINMPKEKKNLLEHMIASHHGNLDWGAIQKPGFLEAYVLHYIDMIDSRIETIDDILNNMIPGEFYFNKEYSAKDKETIYKPIYMNE